MRHNNRARFPESIMESLSCKRCGRRASGQGLTSGSEMALPIFFSSQLPPLFFLFCSLSRIVPSSSPLPLGKKASAPHAKEQKTQATTHSPKAMTERELIDLTAAEAALEVDATADDDVEE